MGKINGKVISVIGYWLLVIGLFTVLVYSRFVNLGWGLPYPMHPDERNMTDAIQQLSCQLPSIKLNLPKNILGEWEPVSNWIKIRSTNLGIEQSTTQAIFDLFHNCFNPHFFAYGQFPLYLGYIIVYFLKFFDGDLGFPISFQEAAVSLRIISTVASIINVLVLVKIIELILNIKNQSASWRIKIHIKYQKLLILLILILSPYAIQFAHFGTTESLLMLFYSTTIYFSLLLIDKKISTLSFVVNSSIAVGLSMATKISSLLFLVVPLLVLLLNIDSLKEKTIVSTSKNSLYFYGYKVMNKIIDLTILVFLSLIIFVIFSPHNFINFPDFLSSMNYESSVALGKSMVFYTRQFLNSEPFYFQMEKVFPYALGWSTFILGSLGMLTISWKDKKINLLRFAFFTYFIPSAIIYAKWSRFMAPIFPIITVFAIILILNIKNQILKIHIKYQKFYILICHFVFYILIFAMTVPGLAYLHIYQTDDVRFQASEWIYKNIPNNSYILSETANVIDIPIPNPKSNPPAGPAGGPNPNKDYQIISFNFYELDEIPERQTELADHLKKADYIFIPSRRIFANHSKEKYPILSKYYEDLFSGKLGFKEVAEFDSFPTFNFSFFTFHFSFKFPDEQAEETWTVFDHPVIRIYKKTK